MTGLLRDLRFAARSLLRAPGLATIAVLILGAGLGAATIVYGLADAILVHPLPYRDADRLALISETVPGQERISVSWPDFEDFRARSRSFSGLAAIRFDTVTLTGGGEPEYLAVHMFSAGTLATLGVAPLVGREFTAEEERVGGPRAVLLEHHLWRTRFASDPAVLGRSLTLDGSPHTIVGVLPEDFQFLGSYNGAPTGLVVPFSGLPELQRRRGNHPGIWVMGRLAPGVTLAQAREELVELGRVLEEEHADANGGVRPVVRPAGEFVSKDLRGAVLLLLGAVVLVVLVAVVDVAGLLLARGIARQKELAVRAALGAGRAALVRQLLAEALVLAGAGGLLGLLLAAWGLDAVAAARAHGLPILRSPGLHGAVLAAAGVAALVAGVLAGILPALALSEPRLHEVLKAADLGASGGTSGRRARTALVVAELALAFVLLAGAAMSVRGLGRLYQQDLGLDPRGVLTFGVASSPARYDSVPKLRQHLRAIEERLRAVPGVEVVAASGSVPFAGQSETWFGVVGRPPPPRGQDPTANYFMVGPGYDAVLRLRLLAGRAFGAEDEGGHRVVLVNESLAKAFFPGEEAVGRYLGWDPEHQWEIVGVVKDVPAYGLAARRPTPYQLYYALSQLREETFLIQGRDMTFSLRTSVPPLSIVRAVREAVREVDPEQAIHSVNTLEGLMRDSVARERAASTLLAGFAAFALVLASVGLYGLVSHGVARRTRELGLRMALGATPGGLVRMVIGQGLRLTALGLAVGLALALALARVMGTLVAGSGVAEPLLLAGLAAVLAGVAALASFLPARRATRIDPGVALREE